MDLIIKSLVEAGYFRARISTLSDFDKVIGGMAWAMQVFSQEIDINIFYKDTLDLGQKIALTERIVMVLLVMNCPHKIEPHQIVGLDHINLLPVVKWLIKRSSEIRREHEAFNRLLALRHYHRVTGTLINRAQWCRVLHIDRLRDLSEKKAQSESITSNEAEKVDEAELEFVNRLESDFKGSQLVSFVSSQPAFLSTANDNRDTQADNTENNALDDELSDDSVDRTDSVHERGNGDELDDNVDQHAKTDEHESIAEECQGSPELIALHKELDTELLATNQKILTLLKKVDSMPTDLEIIQYQRRYIELHQELISKNKDLKKIYALFNSLDSVKHYLSKEMNLLDSIMSNLELTNDNPNNRYEFLRQFQEIITKIQAVKSEVTGRLETMRNRCDLLNEEYTRLRDSYDGDF